MTIETEAGGVTATAYHPFWVIEGQDLEERLPVRHFDVSEDRGGSVPGRWVNSHDLREADAVFLRNIGTTRVRRIQQRTERTPVCNLTVGELHTFAVGEAQVLVHNVSGSGGAPIAPLTPAQQSAIRKIDNIIRGHLKPGPRGDISGTVADMVGSPIPKPGGGFWDHVQEMQNTLRGLRKHAATLEGVTCAAAQAARQRALDAEIEAAIRCAGL